KPATWPWAIPLASAMTTLRLRWSHDVRGARRGTEHMVSRERPASRLFTRNRDTGCRQQGKAFIVRAAVLHGPGDVRYDDRPEPGIINATDAIIRMSVSCICGSDLWPYRALNPAGGPAPLGPAELCT